MLFTLTILTDHFLTLLQMQCNTTGIGVIMTTDEYRRYAKLIGTQICLLYIALTTYELLSNEPTAIGMRFLCSNLNAVANSQPIKYPNPGSRNPAKSNYKLITCQIKVAQFHSQLISLSFFQAWLTFHLSVNGMNMNKSKLRQKQTEIVKIMNAGEIHCVNCFEKFTERST